MTRLAPVLLSFVLLCAARPSLPAVGRGPMPDRPNVILIVTDDQGYGDLGIHGNDQIDTPHLDRLAREGVELTRFYCSPVCAPTRASLMTGRYYYRTGVIHTSRGGAKMHGDELTIAEYLSRAGYRTGIFGKWHLGDNYPMRPQDQGFQESLVHKSGGIGQTPDRPNSYHDPVLWHNGRRTKARGYCTDVFFDAASRFIESHRDERFFVYLPTNAPHTPLAIGRRYSDPYKAKGLDDTTAKVYGMVTNIDDNVGRLLARLRELKLRDSTLIIFLSDNGPQQARYNAGLRGRKGSTYEGGIRAACFVQWPARLEGGRKIDRITAHIDIAPTILSVCVPGLAKTAPLDGRSLMPLLEGRADDWPDRTLLFQCHRGLVPNRYQNFAAVTQRFKLMGYPGTFSDEQLDTAGEPILELYDLAADMTERHNLVAKRPQVARGLRTAYEAWLADVSASRSLVPGVIHIGSEEENPARLCRYQDANYRGGQPRGWSVRVEVGGRYRFAINRGPFTAKAKLHVRWNSTQSSRPLAAGADAAVFDLAAGQGVLEVWFVEEGKRRRVFSDNDTVGDVDVEQLD